MTSQSILRIFSAVFLWLFSYPLLAQIPRDIPRGTGPIQFETPFDYFLYVGMPLLIIILFLVWRGRRRKNSEEVKKSKKRREEN